MENSRSSEPRLRFDEILMPGEREQRLEVARRVSGVPVGPVELKSLNDIAKRVSVEPIVVGDKPPA